jgi:hypothetical protein
VAIDIVHPGEQDAPRRAVFDRHRGLEAPFSEPDALHGHATGGRDPRSILGGGSEDARVAELMLSGRWDLPGKAPQELERMKDETLLGALSRGAEGQADPILVERLDLILGERRSSRI